ncbi:MAG: hypothetical protein JSU70_05220, partial [Phycisphaerales bacterium]
DIKEFLKRLLKHDAGTGGYAQGECSDFGMVLVAKLRAQGIPARAISGEYVQGWNYHCWAEFWDGTAWKVLDATPGYGDDATDPKDYWKDHGMGNGDAWPGTAVTQNPNDGSKKSITSSYKASSSLALVDSPSPLEIIVTTDKPVYTFGETVDVRVEFKNTGSSDEMVESNVLITNLFPEGRVGVRSGTDILDEAETLSVPAFSSVVRTFSLDKTEYMTSGLFRAAATTNQGDLGHREFTINSGLEISVSWPDGIDVDEEFTVTARVRNALDVPVNNISAYLATPTYSALDDTEYSIRHLGPGETNVVRFPTSLSRSGPWTFIFAARSDDSGGSTIYRDVNVLAPPLLDVRDENGPDLVEPGQPFVLSGQIENLGDYALHNVAVTLALAPELITGDPLTVNIGELAGRQTVEVRWEVTSGTSGTFQYAIYAKDGTAQFKDLNFGAVRVLAETPELPIGPDGGDGYMGIREVIDNGPIADQGACYASLNSGAGTIVDYTASVLNIQDSGDGGHYGNDDVFGVVTAGHRAYGAVDDASLMARGTVRIPEGQGGKWTFGVNSDDGVTLQFPGHDFVSVANGEIVNFGGGAALRFHDARSPADTLGVIELPPGDHPFWLTYNERLVGAAVELYAGKGSLLTFDPSKMRLVGHKSIGAVPIPGFCNEVIMTATEPGLWSGGQIVNLQNALDALVEGVFFGTSWIGVYPVVNHSDPDDGAADPDVSGYLMADLIFPNNGLGDDNDFGVLVTGELDIPVAGTYQLGFNSDDGAVLQILGQTWNSIVADATGNAVIVGDQLVNDSLTGWSFTAGEIDFPQPGCYEFSAVMFERGGGSFFELLGRGTSPTTGLPDPRWHLLTVGGAGMMRDPDGLQLVAPPEECFPDCHPDYPEWVTVGKPPCWCYPRQCHGDTDGSRGGSAKAGYYYVGPTDLNVLVPVWLLREPPFGPGIASVPNGICADFAHDQGGSSKSGYYRVGPSDLNILIANWLKKEPPLGPGIQPDCLDCP